MVEQVLTMNELNTKITMMLMPKNKHLDSLMVNKSKTRLELSNAILLNQVLDKVKYYIK
jgi:hypothetical protein